MKESVIDCLSLACSASATKSFGIQAGRFLLLIANISQRPYAPSGATRNDDNDDDDIIVTIRAV